MKINKLLVFLTLTLFVVNHSHAAYSFSIIDWGTIYTPDSSSVSYSRDYDKEVRSVEAVVSHSDDGQQRFYINLRMINGNICENHSSNILDIVNFNGQAVRMTGYCNTYDGPNKTYYSYTPYTDNGHNYVINLFKKSTLPVKVTVDGDTIDIPVMGFTKVWNNFGGDAI